SIDSDHCVTGAGLKAADKSGTRGLHEFFGIYPQPVTGMPGKQPVRKHGQAPDGQSFRTPHVAAGLSIAIAPVNTGTGIERHADNGKVEFRARARRGSGPMLRCGKRHPTIVAVDSEVAPAGMEWNFE